MYATTPVYENEIIEFGERAAMYCRYFDSSSAAFVGGFAEKLIELALEEQVKAQMDCAN